MCLPSGSYLASSKKYLDTRPITAYFKIWPAQLDLTVGNTKLNSEGHWLISLCQDPIQNVRTEFSMPGSHTNGQEIAELPKKCRLRRISKVQPDLRGPHNHSPADRKIKLRWPSGTPRMSVSPRASDPAPEDATSRYQGAKSSRWCEVCELLGESSLL